MNMTLGEFMCWVMTQDETWVHHVDYINPENLEYAMDAPRGTHPG